jgi:hypothetical protein
VTVPAGGIGGIRFGLHGSTDVYFALTNDPFATASGRCAPGSVRATLAAFVRAFDRGDLETLDRLFSTQRFVWYSSGAPGMRRLAAARNRSSLVSYFAQRHRLGDQLRRLTVQDNGFDAARSLADFGLRAERRAVGFRRGRWFALEGKGALDCSTPAATIAVLSLGGPRR